MRKIGLKFRVITWSVEHTGINECKVIRKLSIQLTRPSTKRS